MINLYLATGATIIMFLASMVLFYNIIKHTDQNFIINNRKFLMITALTADIGFIVLFFNLILMLTRG